MNAVVTPKGKIRLYACGGAAINIASMLPALALNSELMADIDVTMVDTSRANLLAPAAQQYNTHLIENVDGSGKKRDENAEKIKEEIPNILHQHKPADLNIVLASASGGSGSVIGPLLVRQLLDRKASTIVLAVGSTGDKKETENSLKTLQTYDKMASMAGMPVNVLYLQNSVTMPEAKVDETILSAIQYLSILFSRRNERLDSQDLKNWLNFPVVTSYDARLTSFTILVRDAGDRSVNDHLEELGEIISIAALIPKGANALLNNPPEYHTVGILPPMEDTGVGPNVLQNKAVRFVLFDGQFQLVVKSLEADLKKFSEKNDTRPRNNGISSKVATADDDGLIM